MCGEPVQHRAHQVHRIHPVRTAFREHQAAQFVRNQGMKNQGSMTSGFLDHGPELLWRADIPASDHRRGCPLKLHESGSDHPLRCLASGVGNYENHQHGSLATLSVVSRCNTTCYFSPISVILTFSFRAACAAAIFATGTRYGEQLT